MPTIRYRSEYPCHISAKTIDEGIIFVYSLYNMKHTGKCTRCKLVKDDCALKRGNGGRPEGNFTWYVCTQCETEYTKKYRKSPQGRRMNREAIKRWRRKNPEKVLAHQILRDAIQKGEITRGDTCALCGSSSRIHGHHHDYSKPLDVTWLCNSCHAKLTVGVLIPR